VTYFSAPFTKAGALDPRAFPSGSLGTSVKTPLLPPLGEREIPWRPLMSPESERNPDAQTIKVLATIGNFLPDSTNTTYQ
jgi:hypothetical protein